MAQLAVSVAGAAIGFALGGPAGAQWGWMVGTMVSSVLFPQRLQGPHMADLKVQNSAYGQPIPVVYGEYRLAGNVIWAAAPVEHSSTSGGKGGPRTTTYSYSESFAVGLCEGPIVGVRRIWANGKLIYDVSADADPSAIAASANIASAIRIYLGSETQDPDPMMESYLGAGNVPAYRGLAYVVFTDFDLTPYGNYLPALSFEVIGSAELTSPWSQQELARWSYPTTLGSFFSATHLDPSQTRVLAWGYYSGFDAMHLGTLTPYGASSDGTIAGASPGMFPAHGRSDTFGAFARGDFGSTNMVWIDGLSGAVTQTAIPNLPFAFEGTSYAKEGSVIWASAFYASTAYHLYRYDLDTGALTTSTLAGTWSVIGVSSSYCYVANNTTGDILQFDKTTLALVSTLSTGLYAITIGHVIDDSLMYFAQSGGGIWRLEFDQGAFVKLFDFPGAFSPHSIEVVNDSTVLYTVLRAIDNIALYVAHSGIGTSGVALSSIVSDLCTRIGLSPSQVDVSQLNDLVQGYAITNRSMAKSNLQPLMALYFFDACDTNAKLKFVKRGADSVLTIPGSDLGAAESKSSEEGENPIIGVRAQETELPQLIEMTYVGAQNDYDNATQRAIRLITASSQKTTLQVPVVLRDDEARGRCELMLWSQWVARTTFTFATSLAYLKCEPSDVVTLIDPDSAQHYLVRLTHCQSNGKGQLIWTAVSEDPSLYALASPSVGGSAAGFVTPALAYAGPTRLAILDTPPLRDTDTTPAIYLAVCGFDPSWPGAEIALSRDGVTFAPLVTLTQAATIGFAQTALGNFTGDNTVDETNTVTVTLINGTLSSTDQAGLLAGTNAALLGQEILFFREATLTSASTYTLKGLLRGRQGTEWAMGTHTVSDVLVLLTPSTLYKLPLQISDLGSTLKLLPTTLGQTTSINNAQSLTVAEACVRPLAPSGCIALEGSVNSPSDLTFSWGRRARVNAAWLNGTDVSLDERSESYRVQVLGGSTVVRTVTVSNTQSWIDLPAPLGPV